MVVKQTEDLAAEALKPPSSTSPKEQAAAATVAPNDSYVTPSRALVPPGLNVEADFDRNPTDLYLKLYRKDWEAAVLRTKKYPYEACIWITRKEVDGGLRWRLLPIHCAVIYRAPEKVILALLFAFPEGAKSKDDQGNLPLHLAYRVGSNENIVRVLLWAYPESVEATDSEGRTPKVLAQTYKSNFTGAFLRILESQSGAATTTKVETVAEEPQPAPAVTKVEPKAEPIAKVEHQQHPAVQTPAVAAAKAEPPSPVKVEAPLSPAVEEPQLELETRDDTGATGAATATTTTQEGSFVNGNYQSINKEEVCHDPISDHRLMMEKDLSEAEYTANDNNARQPTEATEPVVPDKITEASIPPMSVEEERIVSPVAVPPEGDDNKKNSAAADPPLHSEEEKPVADPTPSVPEPAIAAPPKTTPATTAGGYTPALTVDTNIAAVTSNNSAKESSPRPWSPTTEAEFLKEEAMNHVRFMASISGSNDTNDVSKTVAAIMARSSLSPSADQQQQQQQQQQRALSPTAIVRNLSSPVPPEAASADLGGGIIGKDDHHQQNQQQPQQQQHRDPYDELIAEMKIELQKEIQAFDNETEENLRPLQEQVDSLRKNLTKNQESSQVLADHAISLEGQLDSRGETERYLATRIAKLDSELKAIARMKDSSEVTLKKSIESHNEDKKSLLRMVDFLRKQNAEEARALDGIFKTTEQKKKQLEVEVGRLNKKIKILQQDCDCVRSDAEILESQLKKRIENESALALQATTLSSKLAATGKDSNLQTASFSARMRVMMRERNDLRVTANHLTDKLNVVLGRMEAMAAKQEGLKERAEENREEWTRAASNQAKVLSSTRELDAYVTERSEHDAIVEFAKKLDDLKEKTRKERELIADVLNWKTAADSEDEEDPLLGLDEHAERLESGSQKQREFAKNANDLHAELSSMIAEVNDELKKELPERVDIEAENPPAGSADELSSGLDKEIDVDTIIAEVASVLSKDVDSKQDADSAHKKAPSTEYVSQLMMGRRAAEISQHDEEKIVATSFSQECTLQEFETKLSVDSTLANSSTTSTPISSPPPSDCSTKKKVSFSESLVEEHIVEKVNVQPKVAAAVLEMEPAEGDEEQRDDSEGTELVVVEGGEAAAAKPVEEEGDGSIEINMAKLYEILGRVEELRDDPEEKKVLQAVKAAVVKQKSKMSSPRGGGGDLDL